MPFTSRLVPMNLNTEVLRKRLVGQEVSAGSADDEASADKGKEGSSKDQTSSPPPNKKARTDTASQLATISADDCEGDKHAPRIKLLKKRLAGDESN